MLSDEEIDYFFAVESVIIVCNVSLKVLREISFVFGLNVLQGSDDLKLRKQRRLQAKVLENYETGLERSSSQLFHVKNRVNLMISDVGNSKCSEKEMISFVIAIPSSFADRFLDTAARIKK